MHTILKENPSKTVWPHQKEMTLVKVLRMQLLVCGNIDTNVCWLAGSEYDCLLAHFFRAILFHYLSFMKVYTTEQKYYVRQNLSMCTYTHLSGVQYRKVMFSFGLGARPLNHEDSSDYEATEEGLNQEEEEKEEEEEEKKVEQGHRFFNTTSFSSGDDEDDYEPVVDATFEMTLTRDRGLRLRQPFRFNRIVQNMEEGVVLTELEQMKRLWWSLGDIIAAQEEIQRDRDRALEDSERKQDESSLKRGFSQVDK